MSSATSSVIKGSCFCKGIQYEVASGTAEWNRCYCSMCRKLVGAESCTFFAVPYSKLQLKAKETMKTFRSSKDAVRSFCSNCGCSLSMKYEIEANTIWINAATLDQDIPVMRPKNLFTDDKVYWLKTMDSAPNATDMSGWEVDRAKDL